MTPLDLIKVIRESFIGSEIVYGQGSCYRFYLILKTAFPQAQPFTNCDHVISKIDGQYYDINGRVSVDAAMNYTHFSELNREARLQQAQEIWKFNIHDKK